MRASSLSALLGLRPRCGSARRSLLSALAALAVACGCQPPAPNTTERIIRIQIEGCEDATPVPVLATPTPALPPTKAAMVATEIPMETPAAIQPPVERTPPAAARTAQELAAEFAPKREGVLAALAEAKLSLLDLPNAGRAVQQADDRYKARQYDEALRYIEVAALNVRDVRINEEFMTVKFRRVESRVDAALPTLEPAEADKARKLLGRAQKAFLSNSFKPANSLLYELELGLDRKKAGLPLKRTNP